MEVLGKAVAEVPGPYRVLVSQDGRHTPRARSTAEVQPGVGVRVADATTRELALWLAEALNRIVEGLPVEGPPAQGALIRLGHFEADGGRVIARGRLGRAVPLLRAAAASEAEQLAEALNAVVATPHPGATGR